MSNIARKILAAVRDSPDVLVPLLAGGAFVALVKLLTAEWWLGP
jgi:hypothetical protein